MLRSLCPSSGTMSRAQQLNGWGGHSAQVKHPEKLPCICWRGQEEDHRWRAAGRCQYGVLTSQGHRSLQKLVRVQSGVLNTPDGCYATSAQASSKSTRTIAVWTTVQSTRRTGPLYICIELCYNTRRNCKVEVEMVQMPYPGGVEKYYTYNYHEQRPECMSWYRLAKTGHVIEGPCAKDGQLGWL